jgi:D-tyrosyl-tRNA(Tyr) deacylase
MRVVIQRVARAAVSIGGEVRSGIGPGLLVLLGVQQGDSAADLHWLVGKVARLRLFADAQGKMNQDLRQARAGMLVISQFTLHASTRKGNRPSFLEAAAPAVAKPLYDEFVALLEAELGQTVGRGVFGADMQVELVNDGPVTVMLDSRLRE